MSANFAKIFHDMTYTDEVDHLEYPPKWGPMHIKAARRRIATLRKLLRHASNLGYLFNDEYADSPETEIARLEDTLAWIKDPKPRKVFKFTKMAQAQIDSVFDTAPLFSMLRGKALAIKPSPNKKNYT